MTREEWLRVKDVTAAVARLKTTTVVNEAYVKISLPSVTLTDRTAGISSPSRR